MQKDRDGLHDVTRLRVGFADESQVRGAHVVDDTPQGDEFRVVGEPEVVSDPASGRLLEGLADRSIRVTRHDRADDHHDMEIAFSGEGAADFAKDRKDVIE
jgi:hypothetical protein